MSDPTDPYRRVDPEAPVYPPPPVFPPPPVYPPPSAEVANVWSQPDPAPSTDPYSAAPSSAAPYSAAPYSAAPYSGGPYGGAPASGPTAGYSSTLPVPYPPAPASYPPVQQYPPVQSYPYAAGYGAAQPSAVLLVRPPNSGVAVAALVLGIIGFFGNVCSCGVPSVVAIVLGHIGMAQTKSGAVGGRGMAVAGLVLGYIVFVPVIIIIVFFGGLTFVTSLFGAAGAAGSP